MDTTAPAMAAGGPPEGIAARYAPRSGTSDEMVGPDGAIRVSLATLATLWQGDFATLWRTPPGFTGGSVRPDGPLAGWLLEQLGAYQAGALPLDLPLRQRIEAFQRAQGLDPDGIAGALTLMQLTRATGADEPRLERVR